MVSWKNSSCTTKCFNHWIVVFSIQACVELNSSPFTVSQSNKGLAASSSDLTVMYRIYMATLDISTLIDSTGPVQEPSGVPTDSCQAGSSHHSLHATADQRSALFIRKLFILHLSFKLYITVLFFLLHLSRFSSRYDIHSWGQQDIYRQFGQFWENGEVLKVQIIDHLFRCIS